MPRFVAEQAFKYTFSTANHLTPSLVDLVSSNSSESSGLVSSNSSESSGLVSELSSSSPWSLSSPSLSSNSSAVSSQQTLAPTDRQQQPLPRPIDKTPADDLADWSPPPSGTTKAPILAGYGHGLPLSRLFARYLNGELSLLVLEGVGCQAYIYLKRKPEEAYELLPIFNRTAKKFYQDKVVPGTDWISRSPTDSE
ncbi:unnamed protein product [Protopolystoma xenopodis]|uniref:Protein-serine/threonine kinase n=1 Tax=Protopolystoma xenopodis TaxID=117903 RepID=A0A3S5A339_9PLAT|nr:unnamed protein product [Protopolystoma xenopodis]